MSSKQRTLSTLVHSRMLGRHLECDPSLKTDQTCGEHGTITRIDATPIGVQSCPRGDLKKGAITYVKG